MDEYEDVTGVPDIGSGNCGYTLACHDDGIMVELATEQGTVKLLLSREIAQLLAADLFEVIDQFDGVERYRPDLLTEPSLN